MLGTKFEHVNFVLNRRYVLLKCIMSCMNDQCLKYYLSNFHDLILGSILKIKL